jgi:hypothetical protein
MGMTKTLNQAMRTVHRLSILVIPIRWMRRLDVSFGPDCRRTPWLDSVNQSLLLL